uniref:COMM domain-containing protein n=1 Tax=Mesocestoides corti TaxID=53468 RepID=A0A5K3ESG6_MESCO
MHSAVFPSLQAQLTSSKLKGYCIIVVGLPLCSMKALRSNLVVTKVYLSLYIYVYVFSDEISAMNQLPQSTPNKINFPPIRKLVPRDNADFLKDVSTPPDTPTKTLCHQPLNQMPNETQDLSLTLTSFADIGATSRACSNASRRRLPWTLSETLALWHEIQIALPGPPSWAKIRDKVFSTSRRTNVDLKDRWRVILRNPALQAQIRQYYGKWLASKNAVRTDMP